MQTIRWYPLLALGMLVVPIAGRAQTAAPKGPQPKITEIGTVPGFDIDEVLKMPNGHVVIFGDGNQGEGVIASYDLTTKQTTMITRGWYYDLAISPRGDRLVYVRQSEDKKSDLLWTIPLDAATGKPTGPAQKLTTAVSNHPSFSPDGRFVVFAAGLGNTAKRTGLTQSLTVIPATGGTPRLVGGYQKLIRATSWSANGKWIYVQLAQYAPDTTYSIERVPAAGGKSEVLVSGTTEIRGSIEDRITFYSSVPRNMPVRPVSYVTAGGARGEFAIPAGKYYGARPGTPGLMLTSVTYGSRIHITNLDNGRIVDLPFDGTNAANAAWSADQKRLAFGAGEDQHPEIVVINSDGSGQRRYPVVGAHPRPYWSPDGSNLVYHADSSRQIRVLNLATGSSRVIALGPAQTHFSNLIWQPDGKAFLTVTWQRPNDALPTQFSSEYAIVEVRLDGTRRMVRDLSKEFPDVRVAFLPTAREAVLEFGDSALAGPTRILVVPLDGGPARQVSMPPLESGLRSGWVIAYSEKWFATVLFSSKLGVTNRPVGFRLMSTGGDSTRVPHVPEGRFIQGLNVVLPSGHVVTIGMAPGDKDYTLYSVPPDGAAPRVIGHSPAQIIGMGGWSPILSPDGKRFVGFSFESPTTHLYDIDLTPILNLIKKP